jgi:hypothetical protein
VNRPPRLEACCSLLAGFVVRKSFSTSLWVALLHAVAAALNFEYRLFEENSRIITIEETT